MFNLDKNNITEYLKEKMPQLDYSKPLSISMVGDEDIEVDGDGYLNFIFRVNDGKTKVIIKQGRTQGRVAGFEILAAERTRLEYESMKIRETIVPEYIPKTYFLDEENQVMAMEDVSHLSIARFQLNKSVIFPNLARDSADYLAKIHFYTSEYYLETEKFRELNNHFTSHRMRNLFDDLMFLTTDGDFYRGREYPFSEEIMSMVGDLVLDPAVRLSMFLLRDKFMSKSEALLHTDLHTSNIFIGNNEFKAIDMEYPFCGPIAFDLGYLVANFVSQYVTAAFRDFPDEGSRRKFRDYMLDTIREYFTRYCETFFACWDRDVKGVYRGVPGLKEDLKKHWLADMIGYCSTVNMTRLVGAIEFPEYDSLPTREKVYLAHAASVLMDREMMLKRERYESVEEWIADITRMMDGYLGKMA